VPSATFSNRVDDLVRDTKDVPQVIFHCALSQQRWVTVPISMNYASLIVASANQWSKSCTGKVQLSTTTALISDFWLLSLAI
jgi:hypothetical protein